MGILQQVKSKNIDLAITLPCSNYLGDLRMGQMANAFVNYATSDPRHISSSARKKGSE